ncbi:eukaryotic translation initiation factor 3 subunit J [Toxorhynchites rutilus septentrionalis]|uniref:eukaryotic translation initiation factor 3 subunit J n=1 Tax=Toxorhynchites rutilus septentrionalis TaxID=329112 RepID=UPI00247A0FD8|nr:eukaryotic translation initiation factor 3 subunit J [Toxorhynchites rutilus septentrionalis]XP_055625682.1 eukaryotic translation initiation factor 3 subunit J [Toxorhynchites rutilus septentrionalis]
MEEDWEQLSEQEKIVIPAKKAIANKWDGEDEEDDVKDSWEDEDEVEEKKDEEKVDIVKPKPKKTLQQKILEKEMLKQQALEQSELEKEENLTPEQKLAEKLRIQKLQEESDLKNALDTFGVTEVAGGIDGMHPTNMEEFTEFSDAICKKLSNYKSHADYPNFLEDLVTKLFASLPSHNIRKVKGTLDNLYLEKQKIEKGDKPKKSKGGKVKAKLRFEGDNTKLDEYATKYDDFDDYDDFM